MTTDSTSELASGLDALERRARELDTSGEALESWLLRLAAFSRDYVTANADGPAYRPPANAPALENRPLPRDPRAFDDVLGDFADVVLTRGIVPTSGRFMGYVPGGALPSAAIGDYLAALTNRYAGVFAASPGAAHLENTAIAWLAEMIGYPKSAWGTLQSGGSLATLAAVIAARETRPPDAWPRGVVYSTEECHLAVRKALHIAGLAAIPTRTVAVDREFRLDVGDLERWITQDREGGLEPWMVFASAGTVNTGAIDPLDTIADIAARERLWFHVDGAYGGFFVLTERARSALAGMARADSVVLDPHKGLFLPYGCGAVLVRDGETLRKGLSFTSSYLEDVRGDEASPSDYSPELTRHFRGARLWLSLELHGIERFRAALEEKLLLARLAQERLRAMDGIEAGPEPQLSCVAFRARGDGDAATQRMLERMLGRGRIHLSSTRLWGRLWLRLCILCFRSHRADLEVALEEIAAARTSV